MFRCHLGGGRSGPQVARKLVRKHALAPQMWDGTRPTRKSRNCAAEEARAEHGEVRLAAPCRQINAFRPLGS